MKRKTAKEILVEAFREVANEKDIDKITIKDITENCGYSTATFYRQFKDKYDLIVWSYRIDLENILELNDFDEKSWKQMVDGVARYYNDHRVYLKNLLLHTEGYDSFIRNMAEINYSSLKEIILRASDSDSLDESTEMLMKAYVSGAILVSCEWILGKYKGDFRALTKTYENALPPLLKGYLFK